MKTVLVLAPHTDDGEIGCGGFIAKHIEQDDSVFYAAFSVCEDSIPAGFPKDILEREVKAATFVLGIPLEHLMMFRYPVRHFGEYRQNILDDMISIRNKVQPDVVLMPCLNDIHQDHQVIAAEGLRAFKNSSLLCYEMPWNNLSVNTTAFVALEQRHVDRKIEALARYTSQKTIRAYFDRGFVEGLARVRGVQVNAAYAEAFEVLRWIM